MKRNGRIPALCLSVLLLTGCAAGTTQKEKAPDKTENRTPDYLVLVNKENLIDTSYAGTVTLVQVEDVEGGYDEIEEATFTAYTELRDALLEKNIEIGVDSAYRSIERQQEIMDEFTEKYGEEYAKATVALPRTSEHHTGLAVDIVPKVNGEWVLENEDMLKETEIFRVIHETLPEYGFILRYPEGKEDITGYAYEPWHIRYVGKETARLCYEEGLTLEELVSVGRKYD